MPTYRITEPLDLGNGNYVRATPYAPALVVLGTAPPGGVLVPAIPVISAVVLQGADTTIARIGWTTDIGGDSKIRYRANGAGAFSEQTSGDDNETEHSVTLTALTPGATYEYYVVSVGETDGGKAESGPYYFATVSIPIISNAVPTPAAGGTVCDIAFTLAGLAGASSIVWVVYKAGANLLAATSLILAKVGSAGVNGANTVQLSSLTPSTAYQAIVYVLDGDASPDVCVASVPLSFTTLAL